MALQTQVQTFEAEKLNGARRAQVLVRAEALVPGAGRDAIEPLLADAGLFVGEVDVQADRVVLEGSVACQAVYRQGEESALRALTAQAALNHVLDMPGVQPGMLCRARGEVNHVDARYENGHMVFQVTCDLNVQVLSLSPVEVISAVEGAQGLQTVFTPIRSVKLAAEASELALLKDTVTLPAALDARTALMDWAAVEIEDVSADLGGVRVKGRAMVETLVASGVAGRPGVVVRYPLALDQLVELPEWLTGDVSAEVDVRSIRSRVDASEGDGDMLLTCEIEARVRVLANATDEVEALADIYATQGMSVDAEDEDVGFCRAVDRAKVCELVRGTVLIGENAPGVGTVIATRVHPSIGEWRNENGQGRIEGVAETRVLYMPGGSELPASAEAELPFSLTVPQALNDESMIEMQVLSAEANALMSDRLEMKLQLSVSCETRQRAEVEIVTEITEGAPVQRRPGIVVSWPLPGETAWDIGKRYGIPAGSVGEVKAGKAVVLKV
ncbi:MAG: DUF3794 domain-containing protein [Clostridia bacterium]|nr:DUF3794 domain-containing protein [Clostridia bacterium]